MRNIFHEKISEERTEAQFQKLLSIIRTEFEPNPERVEALLKMYEDLKPLVVYAPASGKMHYHYAYEGGYLDHILHVIEVSWDVAIVYKKAGGRIDFTKQELVFATMHHDLGKVGDENGPYYVPETSEWHREKMNKLFKMNPAMQYMNVYDRTVYLLSQYGVKYTKNEMMGIRLADGMYHSENGQYLMNNDPFNMKSALPHIVHWADHISTVAERDQANALVNG